MELLKIATKIFLKCPNLRRSDLRFEPVLFGLSQLLPAYSNDFDIEGFANRLSISGFSRHVESWISSNNKSIPLSTNQVVDLIGADKIFAFAKQLNITPELATEALSIMIPQLISQQSEDGVLFTRPINKNPFLKFIERRMGAA